LKSKSQKFPAEFRQIQHKYLFFVILLRRFHETGSTDIELLTGVAKITARASYQLVGDKFKGVVNGKS